MQIPGHAGDAAAHDAREAAPLLNRKEFLTRRRRARAARG